jgi:LacI family transcriptional regulator
VITVKDVAKRARVSAGTVSNTLTGKRPVSEATRQRILRAIEDLGYQPNVLARSLVNRRSDTLAVVASGLEYFGPSQTLVGIDHEANALGYSLLLSLLHRPSKDDVTEALAALTSRRVDGIVWAVPEIGDNRQWICKDRLAQLPPIIFLNMGPRSGVSFVSVDNRAGATQAAMHLIAGGRRRFGMISGPRFWWEASERCAGFSDTLRQAGLATDGLLVTEGDWSAKSGEQGLQRLLSERPDLDAVFAGNDQMALGVLRAAHLLGRRVPDDLAVVGFDNIPESGFFWPPLTTVFQHLIEMGRTAVRELHKMIESRRDGVEDTTNVALLLTPELVIRDSSGHA